MPSLSNTPLNCLIAAVRFPEGHNGKNPASFASGLPTADRLQESALCQRRFPERQIRNLGYSASPTIDKNCIDCGCEIEAKRRGATPFGVLH